MTVNIDHPWSARELTKEEIAEIDAKNRELLKASAYQNLPWYNRLIYRMLDRLLLRALNKGMNMEEARIYAPNFMFGIGGFLMGWVACVVAVVMGTALWGYATAHEWLNFTLMGLWAIVLCCWMTGLIQKGYRKLKKKVKRVQSS